MVGNGKGRRKEKVGLVVSDKMDKTAVVLVNQRVKHKLYGKFISKKTRYKAHDKDNECRVGDRVKIEETRPLSKEKRWRIKKIIEKAL